MQTFVQMQCLPGCRVLLMCPACAVHTSLPGLGLLLGTEAPVMTPNGVDFFSFFFFCFPCLAALTANCSTSGCMAQLTCAASTAFRSLQFCNAPYADLRTSYRKLSLKFLVILGFGPRLLVAVVWISNCPQTSVYPELQHMVYEDEGFSDHRRASMIRKASMIKKAFIFIDHML